MKFIYFIAFILSLAVSNTVVAGDHDAILGNWTTAEAKSVVNLYACGTKVCGKIISLKEPNYPADDDKGMAGKVKVDRENPDEKLRSKPTIGRIILKNFEFVEKGLWKKGTAYDPENGKTYKGKLTLASPKLLKVRGFIGFSFIGRTSEWTR